MIWFKKNNKQKTVGSAGNGEGNPYENFEAVFHQEEEIHRQYRYIEEITFHLKEKYKEPPYLTEFIRDMCSVEKVFTEGKIKNWSDEKICGILAERYKKELFDIEKVDKNLVETIHKTIIASRDTIADIDNAVEKLLGEYSGEKEYVSFIMYLRDIYVARIQSAQQGEERDEFKDYFVKARMEFVCGNNQDIRITRLEEIYQEFKNGLIPHSL